MIQEACICNFGIPGVTSLPPHDHNQERCAEDMLRLNPDNARVGRIVAEHYPLRDAVHIWVDWKAVARG